MWEVGEEEVIGVGICGKCVQYMCGSHHANYSGVELPVGPRQQQCTYSRYHL